MRLMSIIQHVLLVSMHTEYPRVLRQVLACKLAPSSKPSAKPPTAACMLIISHRLIALPCNFQDAWRGEVHRSRNVCSLGFRQPHVRCGLCFPPPGFTACGAAASTKRAEELHSRCTRSVLSGRSRSRSKSSSYLRAQPMCHAALWKRGTLEKLCTSHLQGNCMR